MQPLEHASNAELLPKLTGTAAADALAQQYSALTDLSKASFDELQHIPGIGESKAAAIKWAFLLGQRLSREAYPESPVLDNPEAIFGLLREQRFRYSLKTCAGCIAWRCCRWQLMKCPHHSQLPAILWKLQNLAKLKKSNPRKFTQQADELHTGLTD